MEINFKIVALAALVPLVIGFIWYHPKIFGNAWMASAGLTEETLKEFNMLKVFSLTYLFSLFAALALMGMVIHQYGVYSVLMNEPGFGEEGSEITLYLNSFMEKYGTNFRTFKHGALHGVIAGLFLALPILAVNAMYERKGFKYVAINVGFWTVCFTLMGGIICAFA